jgi:hypothetical protein
VGFVDPEGEVTKKIPKTFSMSKNVIRAGGNVSIGPTIMLPELPPKGSKESLEVVQ